MLCIQCGTDNPDAGKYCVSCNALMLVAAPTGNPAQSNLDIEELVDYPVPESSYQSPLLQQLAWSIHEFIEEEGELEPIVEAYEAFREVFEGFKSEIPKLKEICYSQQGVLEDDPMPSQIKYMVSQAETLYAEGEALFESYFDKLEAFEDQDEFPTEEEADDQEQAVEEHEDEIEAEEQEAALVDYPDPTPLVEGTKKWLACNDSVCIAFDFLVGRSKAFGEMMDEVEEILAEAELSIKEGSAAPADSTDLG